MTLDDLLLELNELVSELEEQGHEPDEVNVVISGHGVGTPRELLSVERLDDDLPGEEGSVEVLLKFGRAV